MPVSDATRAWVEQQFQSSISTPLSAADVIAVGARTDRRGHKPERLGRVIGRHARDVRHGHERWSLRHPDRHHLARPDRRIGLRSLGEHRTGGLIALGRYLLDREAT